MFEELCIDSKLLNIMGAKGFIAPFRSRVQHPLQWSGPYLWFSPNTKSVRTPNRYHLPSLGSRLRDRAEWCWAPPIAIPQRALLAAHARAPCLLAVRRTHTFVEPTTNWNFAAWYSWVMAHPLTEKVTPHSRAAGLHLRNLIPEIMGAQPSKRCPHKLGRDTSARRSGMAQVHAGGKRRPQTSEPPGSAAAIREPWLIDWLILFNVGTGQKHYFVDLPRGIGHSKLYLLYILY